MALPVEERSESWPGRIGAGVGVGFAAGAPTGATENSLLQGNGWLLCQSPRAQPNPASPASARSPLAQPRPPPCAHLAPPRRRRLPLRPAPPGAGALLGAVASNWGDIDVVLRDKPWPALVRTGSQMAQYGGTLALVGGTFAAVDVSATRVGSATTLTCNRLPHSVPLAHPDGSTARRGACLPAALLRHRHAPPGGSLRVPLIPGWRPLLACTFSTPCAHPCPCGMIAVLCRERARQEGLGEWLAGGRGGRPGARPAE